MLRSIGYLVDEEKLSLSSVSLYARGNMGGVVLHAAAIDAGVGRVILDHPPNSHREAPAMLNILRFTDLTDLASMPAPREIVSIGTLPAEYEYTRSIFRLYGKEEAIRQADSLGAALKVWEKRWRARPGNDHPSHQ